jgi:hypothetical protein
MRTGSTNRLVRLLSAVALCLGVPVPAAVSAASTTGQTGLVVPMGTQAQVASNVSTAWPARMPQAFYGVNFDLAGFEPFAHTDVGRLLAALEPATIRWPGGTEADFYDWHTGLDTQKPNRTPFTLGDLAAAYRATGAVPIFDLNVLAAANRANPSDQLVMLEQARRLGLPVRYVEIGNELYANGPGFAEAYPDGAAYARTVAAYAEALHGAFPGVEVAADAVAFPEDQRQQSWDKELLNGAVGAGSPDALIVHFYPGLYLKHLSPANLPYLFANAESSIAQLAQITSSLGDKPIWLTEYNFRGPYRAFRRQGVSPAERTYAHELYLAAFAAMLPRVKQLALVDNWTALGDGFYGAWAGPQSPELTPGGQAVEIVDMAARGAVATAPVHVPGAATLPGGLPGVVGQRFIASEGQQRAVLVNLTRDKVALAAASWLVAGTPYEQVTGNPLAPEAKASTLATGALGPDGVELAPYSVTVIGVGRQ